jgi:hypothetical protein
VTEIVARNRISRSTLGAIPAGETGPVPLGSCSFFTRAAQLFKQLDVRQHAFSIFARTNAAHRLVNYLVGGGLQLLNPIPADHSSFSRDLSLAGGRLFGRMKKTQTTSSGWTYPALTGISL